MTSREAFEKWWDSNDPIETPHTYRNWEAGCWASWQASRAALIEEIKAGYFVTWYEAEPLYRLPDEEPK